MEEPWFAEMFSKVSKKEQSIQMLNFYFAQKFGGPDVSVNISSSVDAIRTTSLTNNFFRCTVEWKWTAKYVCVLLIIVMIYDSLLQFIEHSRNTQSFQN